jgi:arylsulfatase A-like enzyme
VDRAGLGDSTYFILTADHSHVPIGPGRQFNLVHWVRDVRKLHIRKTVLDGEDYAARFKALESYDVVGGADEDRTAMLHLHGRRGWACRPDPQEVESWVLAEPSLIDVPAVQFALIRGGTDRARVLSRDGTAFVERRIEGSQKEYRLMADQGDPLQYGKDPALAAFVEAGWHGSREWLEASKDSVYPDFVPQVVEMFDSPHTGDVVVMAADDWSLYDRQQGGHGSWTRRDIRIPLFFAGPGIPKGAVCGPGRLVDVTPTIIALVGEEKRLQKAQFDGINLAEQIRKAQPRKNQNAPAQRAGVGAPG